MMKQKIKVIVSLTLLCGVIIGCNTANTNLYKGVATTQITVETGLGLYNQAIPTLHISTNMQYQVRAYFDKWKAGMLVVCDAGAAYAAGYGSTNETFLAAALQQAITQSDQERVDFLSLLSQIGVKLP